MDEQLNFIPYHGSNYSADQLEERAREFYEMMKSRRSIRDFSNAPVPREVMENIIMTAGTSPSGAHKQPWTFCLISSAELKKKIRVAAEKEEYESYSNRMNDEWLKDLAPIGTDWKKPFLEVVPWIIVVFKKVYDIQEGQRKQNYYVNESVGIACGMLISAIHYAGLATLTHTPSPMNFLSEILERPENERPFLLLPVGYPSANSMVPNLHRKDLLDISKWY